VPVDLTVPLMLTVGAAAFLLGVSKAGLGGGLGPLVTVIVSIFVPPARAIGVLLPLLIVGDVFAVWTHRRSWDRALLLRRPRSSAWRSPASSSGRCPNADCRSSSRS
jgi:hypothetical protein